MARTISKHLLYFLVTGLMGSVLFWCPVVWAQNGPTVAEALARAQEAKLPEPVTTHVLAMALDAGFERTAAARILIVLAEAHRRNFSLEPFQERIAEGIAKRIAGTRIALALEERLDRQVLVGEQLRRANASNGSAYQMAVISLTDGLEMGLTADEVDTLIQRTGNAPVAMTAVAAEMWALLKQLAFDPALTDQIISEGFAQRSLNAAWRNFPQIVVIARRKGVPDHEIGAEALKGLRSGGAPADLLTRLGFTGRDLKTGPMGIH